MTIRNVLRLLALSLGLILATADLPVMEFTANLIMFYKESGTTYTGNSCFSGGCENAIHSLLQPWQEWAMEEMGHDAEDYTCDDFEIRSGTNDDCPVYPIFEGDNTMRVCSRCTFTSSAYEGVSDIAELINTTTLRWVQTHTIDGVRRVLHPTDEALNGCPCLGLKYKYMVDYYVSERGQRRRTRKFMRV